MEEELYQFYGRLHSVVQLMRHDGRAIKVLAACFLISSNCFAYQLRVIAPLEINRNRGKMALPMTVSQRRSGRERVE